MAYELLFRGVKNWVEVAEHVAKSAHTWATEEEEFLGEVGYDIEEGEFTCDQLDELSQPRSLDSFAKKVQEFRNLNAFDEIQGVLKLSKLGLPVD
jgi:hypothetical protein